ncbi:hypothetical protein GCM10009069_15530 [Algimonas arctica]|uniref:DUF1499 domain-containing protein n=1 Tax=Algimonas arctica TaxID=1479486 RepID=A0A8J3G285_9PROT|nr:DUF1499 domain-containing protein [Algimonas arctica]GHA93365.1 hypothetical protein GCM10009069_15530 [Algimonas arctica]
MTDPTPNHPPVVTETPAPKMLDQGSSVSKRQKFRRWVLRIALGLAIASPLLFILAALGTKIGLWSWQFGLGMLTFKIAPLLMIITLVVGVFALLLALLIKPRKGIVIAVIAIIIPVAAFVNIRATQAKVASLPFIHDVTTDTQDPPTFGTVIMAERAALPGVNTVDYAGKRATTKTKDADGKPVMKLVSALQTQAYPQIRTLVLNESPDVAFGRAEQVARDMGWAIKETDAATGRIDATDTTFWYGFKDDVSIRLRPAQGDGTRVDVRSISRVGGSDIGANAARIEAFLEQLAE